MILTGKALEDFKNWYWNEWFEDKERESYQRKEEALYALNYTDIVFMNAILIEWFDSIGIYIDILHSFSFESTLEFCVKVSNTYVTHGIKDKPINRFETRSDAIKQAIKKANEIYNDTNKESINRLP